MSQDSIRAKVAGSRLEHGVTLIEALVTMFVLSVGLVGIGALHLNSMKSAHSSYYRSLASAIALDFEERLWIAASNELSTPGQCLTPGEIDDELEALTIEWTAEPGLPGLDVAVPVVPALIQFTRLQPGASGTWTDRWQEMTVTIEWTEGRFTSDPGGNERFDYVLRVPCVSQYIPGST